MAPNANRPQRCEEKPERNPDLCCCGRYLWGDIERDTKLCGSCADREYEHHKEREEFRYYHPGGDDE